MQKEKNILKNYILYFLFGLLICLVGISGVFADTTIDTSQFINTTGRKWSDGLLEYTNNPSYNTDWLLNAYNVTGGIYTPPNTYDYIEFSYFEHNTSQFNPCNSSGKFTAEFNLLFTSATFNQYVSSVKWGNDSCSIQERNKDGTMKISCVASPSSSNFTGIYVNYNDIQGTATSSLYISRNIGITCGLNTDAIINNDNANTQNIINSNQQNTQQIIDSSASNTQSIIDSNKVCNVINKNSVIEQGKYLDYGGNISTNSGFGITDYYSTTSATITTLNEFNNQYVGQCFYNANKTLISCLRSSDLVNNTSLTIPNNASYIRFSINTNNNLPTFKICQNGSQALDNSINNLDDTLNDDDTSGATSEASDFFSDFTTNTFGLTSIITAPLSLIQSLLSSTCSDLELPLPYLNNKKLTLPCMSTIYSTYFGNFFTLYQTITYGIVAYWVCVRIFNLVKDFKNPEHDEIEVLDL